MKKLLSAVFAAMAVTCVWAQSDNLKDSIIKTDYEIVEAKILEVSSDEVKYKEWKNPDGPTFILKASEIGKIKFGNGTVKKYPVAAAQPAPVAPAAPAAPVYAAAPAVSAAPAAAPQTAQSERSTGKDEKEKEKLPWGIQLNLDLEGNLAFMNGTTLSQVVEHPVDNFYFGGLSAVVGAGARVGRFLYLGAAVGAMGEWGKTQMQLDSIKSMIKAAAYVMPVYADARIYAPNGSNCYPFVELGIGGYVGLDGNLLSDKLSEVKFKPDGGFYLMTGVGLEFKRVTIGAGYKLLHDPKSSASIYSRNHGYVKIGVSLGRPARIRK